MDITNGDFFFFKYLMHKANRKEKVKTPKALKSSNKCPKSFVSLTLYRRLVMS